MKRNPLQLHSYSFAVKIVKLNIELNRSTTAPIAKQLLRSGTAIGALVEEALGTRTKKDFIHKLTISYKEARETRYWISILLDCSIIEKSKFDELMNDLNQILRLLVSILKTLKQQQ